MSDLSAKVRRLDADRWLAAQFAPAEARGRLVALYAFHQEIARVGELVSEPMLGEIRLAWWREALDEIFDPAVTVRRHETALALGDACATSASSLRALLDGLIDARQRDLDEQPFADLGELSAYTEHTAGGLMLAAAEMVFPGVTNDALLARPLKQLGRAWGLTGLARAFGARAAAKMPTVPEDVRLAHTLRRSDIIAGQHPDRAGAALVDLLEVAETSWREARGPLRQAPAALWPAFGYGVLMPGYLRRLRSKGRDPYRDTAEQPLFLRQISLFGGALTGRV